MHEAAVLQVLVDDADIICAVGLEGAGHGVARISQFLSRSLHPLSGGFADILMAVEGFAHGGYGNAAVQGNVL